MKKILMKAALIGALTTSIFAFDADKEIKDFDSCAKNSKRLGKCIDAITPVSNLDLYAPVDKYIYNYVEDRMKDVEVAYKNLPEPVSKEQCTAYIEDVVECVSGMNNTYVGCKAVSIGVCLSKANDFRDWVHANYYNPLLKMMDLRQTDWVIDEKQYKKSKALSSKYEKQVEALTKINEDSYDYAKEVFAELKKRHNAK